MENGNYRSRNKLQKKDYKKYIPDKRRAFIKKLEKKFNICNICRYSI